MELKKIVLENGKEFTFVNESGNSRNGFFHNSTLINENGCELGKQRINYLNRTWESYRFQSVMMSLVYGLIADREEVLKAEFKANKGIKKMFKKYEEEYKDFVNTDFLIKQYREIEEKL